jgi:MlaC protein
MKVFGLVVALLLVLPVAAGAAPAMRPLTPTAPPECGADDLFDAGDLARRVLGQHWKALGPHEQEEFARLFRDIATRAVMRVRARMMPEHGSSMPIEYRLSPGDAQWTVYDIVVDGVSLVANYRSQLNAILGTASVAELLERMRAKASRQPRFDAAVEGAPAEREARGRLVAGLLLGAVARGRWAR